MLQIQLKTYLILLLSKQNNWQMYGSCKPENQCYEITSILKYKDDKLQNSQ